MTKTTLLILDKYAEVLVLLMVLCAQERDSSDDVWITQTSRYWLWFFCLDKEYLLSLHA